MPIPTFPADEVFPLRKAMGLTQTKFAEEIGVARSLVAHWETARAIPSGPAAILLAQKQAELRVKEKSLISA